MKRAVLMLSFAAAVGCAGARGARPERPETAAAGRAALRAAAYECESGKYIVADFMGRQDEVWLFLPGGTLRLKRARSASGARYVGEGAEFWSKGRTATVRADDGVADRCREDPLSSRLESVKLSGKDFWASGNEPGWTLEIGHGSILLVTDYGATRMEFPLLKPREDRERLMTVYLTGDGENSLEVTLRAGPCRDSMSGRRFGAAVALALNGERLTGCGQALH
ncbi:MAG: MliC family protein [Elusimicrobiota bacterium]